MPLPPPTRRRHLHSRRIDLEGFLREDGLIEVEAHLTDVHTEDGRSVDGSVRPAGTQLHDMWLRMTVTQEREIVACHAAMEIAPFAICPGAAPSFGRLVGLRLEGGFVRQAMALVGGTSGCTHLRELLQQMATVVFQTLYSGGRITDDPARLAGRPPLLNSCHGWSEDGDMVRARFPPHGMWRRPCPRWNVRRWIPPQARNRRGHGLPFALANHSGAKALFERAFSSAGTGRTHHRRFQSG